MSFEVSHEIVGSELGSAARVNDAPGHAPTSLDSNSPRRPRHLLACQGCLGLPTCRGRPARPLPRSPTSARARTNATAPGTSSVAGKPAVRVRAALRPTDHQGAVSRALPPRPSRLPNQRLMPPTREPRSRRARPRIHRPLPRRSRPDPVHPRHRRAVYRASDRASSALMLPRRESQRHRSRPRLVRRMSPHPAPPGSAHVELPRRASCQALAVLAGARPQRRHHVQPGPG